MVWRGGERAGCAADQPCGHAGRDVRAAAHALWPGRPGAARHGGGGGGDPGRGACGLFLARAAGRRYRCRQQGRRCAASACAGCARGAAAGGSPGCRSAALGLASGCSAGRARPMCWCPPIRAGSRCAPPRAPSPNASRGAAAFQREAMLRSWALSLALPLRAPERRPVDAIRCAAAACRIGLPGGEVLLLRPPRRRIARACPPRPAGGGAGGFRSAGAGPLPRRGGDRSLRHLAEGAHAAWIAAGPGPRGVGTGCGAATVPGCRRRRARAFRPAQAANRPRPCRRSQRRRWSRKSTAAGRLSSTGPLGPAPPAGSTPHDAVRKHAQRASADRPEAGRRRLATALRLSSGGGWLSPAPAGSGWVAARHVPKRMVAAVGLRKRR